ncbi:MAG TPA: hypothetical protein VE999_01915 [Gemmataceae bacterium]|nr:hypothetical protein [Gemmataceae bacterium]
MSRKSLFTIFVLGILGAIGAYFLGREQERIRSLYGTGPHALTVAELAEKGYGESIWLDLKDVELGKDYVVESRKGSISAVWFPAFPKGKAAQAKSIQVVLRSTRSKNDAEIRERFAGRSSFRGAVINPILLQPYEPYRPLFQQAYPSLALAPTIWEVDIDYTEKPSEKWATGFYAAAAGLGVIGMIFGFFGVLGFSSGKRADSGF